MCEQTRLPSLTIQRPYLRHAVSHFFLSVAGFSILHNMPELTGQGGDGEFSYISPENHLVIFSKPDGFLPHSLYSVQNFYRNHGLSNSVVFFSSTPMPNPYAHGFKLGNCNSDCNLNSATQTHAHGTFRYLTIQWPSTLRSIGDSRQFLFIFTFR